MAINLILECFFSLSWINDIVDGRNDSNQTTKLAVVVVGSQRTQIVLFSHINAPVFHEDSLLFLDF